MNYETKMQEIGQVMDKLAERGFTCTAIDRFIYSDKIIVDFWNPNSVTILHWLTISYNNAIWISQLLDEVDKLIG